MENETIIPMLVALIGALGLKEGWNIWKKKIFYMQLETNLF